MSRHPNDLIAVMAGAVLCALLTQVASAIPVIRLIGAMPLVLFLPGYTITTAAFTRRSLGIPERLLFSLGISLCVVVLTGLALQWTSWGLQAGTWAIVLAGIVVCATAITWRRRRNQSTEASPLKIHLHLRFQDGLLLGLAILVCVAAIGLARMPTPPKGVSGYTLLWMIPAADGNANDYRLGVNSMEFSTTAFRLEVMVDNQVIREWPDLKFAPGESWETSIVLQDNRAGAGSVEAMLYRLDNPDVIYRQVKLQRGE
jgi:uncharacterized membrane protein